MKQVETKRDDGVELETQFILRITEEPAKVLREAIQSGSNSLKDRLSIKLEPDLRYGEVRFDHWLLHAKVVDLPTIIESLKTIDNKSFYKTADVCQMVICKEEPDTPSADEESPNKAKKKDPNKVDKKFLWPHGVTPPCKNVRKRRFRKTLKKKYVEAPEIEKEVKRLLRVDNDAVNVKYEIINEDEEQTKGSSASSQKEQSQENEESKQSEGQTSKAQKNESLDSDGEGETALTSQVAPRDVGEHDIFGGEVSSSDDEENQNVRDMEENSRLSADDSRLSDFSMSVATTDKMITEFNKSMFNSPKSLKAPEEKLNPSHRTKDASKSFFDQVSRQDSDDNDSSEPQMSREQITGRLTDLRRQCDDLKIQQAQKAQEISSIQNPTLRQRMQETLDNVLSQIYEKEMEMQELQNML